mmetsp:Transcript_6123/g.13408  ORF Transcript_6123/g.13408 Transcript_6123/m.13408 type:complete len:366 (-) Transcript_6123:182-1279(-)
MHRMQQTQNRGVSQQTMMMELFGNTTIRFPYYSSRAIPTDVVSTTKRIAYYFLVSRGPLPVPSTATIGAPPWEWSVTNRGGPIVTKRASNPYYRPQHRCCHHRRQTKEAIHHFGFHPGYPIYSFIKPGTPRLQGTIIAIHGTPKYPRPCGGDPQPEGFHDLPPPNIGRNFSHLPRAQLVRESMQHPDLIDAAFTNFVQFWEKSEEELVAANLTRSARRIRFNDQMRYRAIIDIDGNNWSSRFAKLLCTNSVVIKIDPDWMEYFYEDLQPMVHYVPASLENVTDVVAYVMDDKNDGEMKEMVQRANEWCARTNTGEQLPKEALMRLREYERVIHTKYNNSSWSEEWEGVQERSLKYVGDDLVDCNV